MPEHLLFLTGRLAEKGLRRVLHEMVPDFDYTVHQIGINVAALMTTDLVMRRMPDAMGATRVLLPGRSNCNATRLSEHFGVAAELGPEEIRDLPQYFGHAGRRADLSRYDVRIFAEIVDAPHLDADTILERARAYAADGADVIDIGCLPDVPFAHLEEAVAALKEAGYLVSADSTDPRELLRAGHAGADYLLSLTEKTLWVANEVGATPVLIPARSGDLDSLCRAMAAMERQGKPYLADPVLDPIHFGFTDSLVRYHELRRRHPEAPILMGVGNLTELTEADTIGVNTLLMGIISELGIGAVLTTQVSPHACRAVREIDLARRVMFAAREAQSLPRGFTDELLALHALKPFPDSVEDIAELAAAVRDPSFRVQISEQGIHVYNRDGLRTATDPFRLFPMLKLDENGSHAFYMGLELARAQIAWQLGKRYTQDRELSWGCAQRPVSVEKDKGRS